ncbi:NAD(P)/FAD-dependent oxidoreductase [Psychrobacter vallis]|uniref:NAD(P)/FAD-dependent oxidoreductase n=1 Tax=Psychrobacter vallis TaxID=248451 RepID=UPI002234A801|nr:FAD-binding oxidoreductase [Psychrobacter vallis]
MSVNTLEAIGESYEVLSDDALAKRLGTHYYKRAVYTSGNILVNPAALAISVASALPSNVTLLENTPIREIDLASKVIQTPKARLSADTIVLATNAFTEKFGVSSNRITPIFTYASLTRQLDDSEIKCFEGIEPWGLTSAHPAGTTVRLTSDNRIFIRNTLNYQPNLSSSKAVLDKAKVKHRKSYLARFPQLPDVPFEYTWGGMICVTMNHEPVFKEHASGVYVVAAMNGVGVAKGTYLGHYMAEFICGKQSPELDFILKHAAPSWIPPDPLRSVGAHMRLSFEEHMAKGEV